MEAVTWALFGLLGASTGTMLVAYFRLSAKIDELRRDLGGRIDGVQHGLSGRIDALTARMDALNARMDSHIHPHAG